MFFANKVWPLFPNLHTLEDLQLQGNGVTKFNKTIFSNLKYPQNLDLGNNRLTDFPTDIFHKIKKTWLSFCNPLVSLNTTYCVYLSDLVN